MTRSRFLELTKRIGTSILAMVVASVALAAAGCGSRQPAAWTMEGITKGPFWVAVNEAREFPDGTGGQAGPELLVSSGDRVLVGAGTVFVNLQLYRGADFDALKPYIEASPGADFNYVDFADGLRVQVWWRAGGTAQPAAELAFRLKKGAPLGNDIVLQDDFRLTLERRPEPHSTVAVEGNSAIKTPYDRYRITDGDYIQSRSSYTLAPGTYTFRISFTKAMNRKTVEDALARALSGATFRWRGSKQLLATAVLTAKPGYYILSANGAYDRDGMPVWLDDELVISVSDPLKVLSVPVSNMVPGEAKTIATLMPGQKPESVSGDGRRVIAFENPWGNGESGDGPMIQNPWLYGAGDAPREMTAQVGRAFRAGFGSGERIWIVRNGVFYQEYDYSGKATAKVDTDQISQGKYPPGWAISGDGSTVVALARPADRQEQQPTNRPVPLDLLIANTASGATRRFPAFTSMPESLDFFGGMVVAMALSNDGSTLVYADPSTPTPRLTAVDLATGAARPVMPVAKSTPVVLSPDAGKALCKDSSGQWVVVTLADGVARQIPMSPAHTGWAGSVAEPGYPGFSPDGRYLAYTLAADSGAERVGLYDTATGQAADLGEGIFARWSDDGAEVFIARP